MTYKICGTVYHNDGTKNIGEYCDHGFVPEELPTCLCLWRALPYAKGIEAENIRRYIRNKCLESSWYVWAAEWADETSSPNATLEAFIESNNIMTLDENILLRELADEWKKRLLKQAETKKKFNKIF